MTGSTGAASNEFVELVQRRLQRCRRRRLQGRLPLLGGHERHHARDDPGRYEHPRRRLLPARRERLPRLARGRPELLGLARVHRRRARRPRHDGHDPRLGRLRRHDERLRGGPSGHRAADDRGSGQQLRPRSRTATTRTTTRPTSRSARRPRRAPRTTRTTGRAARPACRPPITPTGHARPRRPHRYCVCGAHSSHGVFTNCGNCGDWSHPSAHPRTVALARAHARGCRAGRTSTRAPAGAA